MVTFPLLLLAIAIEIVSTALLPRAAGFTNVPWTLAVSAGYLSAIWLLTIVVRTMDVSIAYALWSGIGTAAIAVIGYLWLGEQLSVAKVCGVVLIVAGVVLVNLQQAGH